ncbi:MAG: ATP-binding protein [Parvularculaceae bacterium]
MSQTLQEERALAHRFERYQNGLLVLQLCLALATLLLYLAVSQTAPVTATLTFTPIFLFLIIRNRARQAAAKKLAFDPTEAAVFMQRSWKVGLMACAYVGVTAVILYRAGGEAYLMPIIVWTGLVGFGAGVLSGPNTPYAPLHVAFAVAPLAICLALVDAALDAVLAAMVLVLSVFMVFTVQEFAILLTSLKESRRNEERLKQNAERALRKFMESASDWAWETDTEHRFTYLSPNFEKLTGHNGREFIGKTRGEAFANDDPAVTDGAAAKIEGLMENREPIDNIEIKFISPSGAVQWRAIKGYPEYNDEGAFTGYCGWAIDVSEKVKARKRLERYNYALERKVALRTRRLEKQAEELKATAEELKVAKEKAEYGSRAKSDFIRNVSHEFRTPLHVILGYSEMLAIKAEDDFYELDQLAAANEISTAGRRLLRLINNVIAFSMIDDEGFNIDQDAIAADDLIAKAMADLEESKIERKVSFAPVKASGLRLRADYAKLSVALGEIIRNAIMFSPESGCVEVRAYDDGDHVGFEVFDEGVGPPSDMQASAFDPFQIGSGDTRTKSNQGVGLGLAIASRLVQAHGGSIEVGSREGGPGARVVIRLPRERLIRHESRLAPTG